MRPRVKICGITRVEDAALAARLGADALGFVFWPESPRAISPAAARLVAAAVPPLVARVGVFVNASPAEVADVARRVGLDAVQLHGDEPAEAYASVPARLIKAVVLHDEGDVDRAAALPPHVTPLVDAADRAQRGGTGRLADWQRAADLARRRPVMLAGGLTAENVADAIRLVRPWAVDVSSGVETTPGVKNAERLTRFLAAIGHGSEDV
ncbi:MAG TPA: phosphoribosylanthranilate isomerase [Vicinamibacterales bacterium]|nr:phosphoribosylanthranilate isomerase [Vicinamibacterales bacterium]